MLKKMIDLIEGKEKLNKRLNKLFSCIYLFIYEARAIKVRLIYSLSDVFQ